MDAPRRVIEGPRADGDGWSAVDPRLSLANERTLLAWNRTALALVAGGLAVTQLLHRSDIPGGRRLLGLPLIALGVALAMMSHRRWREREAAIHAGRPLSPSALPWLLTLGVLTVALLAAVVAAAGGS